MIKKCCEKCSRSREAISVLNPFGGIIYYCGIEKCSCHKTKCEEIQFLKENFSENDNSVDLYKESLVEYLKKVLDNHPSDWSAMSDYTLYLQGAEQMLKEVIKRI